MDIQEFIARCDRYCVEAGRSRVWLSKRLFADTFRLDNLASGKADVGVRRLGRASAALDQLVDESERAAAA